MSFPRYERYKDSGVEWLGEVPEHWQVNRLKMIAEVFPSNVDKKEYDGEIPVRLCNYTDVYYNDVITADMELMSATATQEQIARFTLRSGDTIITKDSETADDIAISAYVPHSLSGVVCGYHLSVVRPKSCATGSFVKRLFDADYVRTQAEVSANGLTRVGLSQYALDNLQVAYPDPTEQNQIAQFIDRETAKIDALVEEQWQLIELLKEKRQAVILHAVTKGLNPDVPKTPSHIEEVGEIPLHWKIVRVRHVSLFITSGPRGWSENISEVGRLFVQSGDLGEALQIDFANCKRVNVEDGAEASRTLLVNGDTVVCITGAKTGNVAVCEGLREPAFVNQHLCLIRNNGSVLSRFLGLFLKSKIGQTYFEKSQYGMKQGLSLEDIREAPVLLPPISEQRDILCFLDSHEMKLDELNKSSETAIHLLQERRSALISAAVSGRIDVRKYIPKEAA
jgi:type I restriction enzyme S subunit